MRIQLIADPEYLLRLSEYFRSIDTIELVEANPEIIFDASFSDPESKLVSLSKFEGHSAVLIANTLTVTASSIRQAIGLESRIIGMPIFPRYFERQKTVEYSLPFGIEDKKVGDTVANFLSLFGKSGEKIEDAIAGIFPRSLAMIINEAAFAVQESVALAEDIDTAMKLGTNYPIGPLAWCDEIGAKCIVATLDALAKEYGTERYRVASLLRRHAEAGEPWHAQK
ncbi:MAG TPA: 3-hydroxyacyl-CoA dehydrogenase family protein [Candidatus Kapabacteria bacterium]|nr:3-hydroxyacyl-CoA dehydrogenase family protein [Candidatus Kapabacteria bacterium]